MASITELKESEKIPIVLRVKRKRTENPVEALVIESKVQKLDTEAEHVSTGVFQLCGSVDKPVTEDGKILEFVQSFKDRSKHLKANRLAKLTLSDSREERRVAKKKSSSNQRYKLISALRCLGTEGEMRKGSDPANKGTMNNLLHLCDAVAEEQEQNNDMQLGETNGLSHNGSFQASMEGAITCNSSVMARERVRPTGDDEYVYDIYYTNNLNMDTFNQDSVVICPYESQLVHDIVDCSDDDEELCEEEDDSNDENNWRNDYPDEDEWERDSHEGSASSDSYIFGNKEYQQREIYYDEYDWVDRRDSESEYEEADDDYS